MIIGPLVAYHGFLLLCHVTGSSRFPSILMLQSGYDSLYKVRPLIYQPRRELAIDEVMVGTRCRVESKFSSTSLTGYVLTYDVYTGRSSDDGSYDHSNSSTHRTVMKLMGKYLNKGHSLFTDKFYTSPLLFQHMLVELSGSNDLNISLLLINP